MKGLIFTLLLGCSFGMGEIVSAATPPKQVIAGPDDTVYGIAYDYGIPTRALIAANNLKPPYVLTKGQVLIVPAPNEHVVGKGETLHTIAENYGLKVDVLAQENEARDIREGDRLILPSRDTESLAEALKPPSQEITTSSLAPLPLVKSMPAPNKSEPSIAPAASGNAITLPDDLAEELAREKNAGAEKTSINTSEKPSLMGNLAQGNAGAPITPSEDSANIIKEQSKPKKAAAKEENKEVKKEVKKKEAAVKEASFIWPVEGTVINKFSGGGKNDGINIKVPEGTPVKAAAAGEVMYAGSELKGFGNLLLIKHKDGWMTAYAHNADLLVKKGDKVKQGQTVAKAGSTGDVKESQLHFEIRKGKQPVDPLPKLES